MFRPELAEEELSLLRLLTPDKLELELELEAELRLELERCLKVTNGLLRLLMWASSSKVGGRDEA